MVSAAAPANFASDQQTSPPVPTPFGGLEGSVLFCINVFVRLTQNASSSTNRWRYPFHRAGGRSIANRQTID